MAARGMWRRGGTSLSWKAIGEALELRAGRAVSLEPGAGAKWFSRH